MADTRIKSIFGAYAENLQALVDKRLDKFRTSFFPQYFDWGVPQVSLSYATAVGRSRIEAAASVVAHGAKAPKRSRPTLEKYTGEVSAIKVAREMKESDYRNFLTVQAMNLTDSVKKQQILRLIWEDVGYVGNAAMDRVDIMVAQALSEGVVTMSAVTNPDGLIMSDIDLLMPSTNKKNVAVVWSLANKATMTPLVDIDNVVQAADAIGVTFEKILMPKTLLRIFSNCDEVINALKGFFRTPSGGTVTNPVLDDINTYMVANQMPKIELIDITKSIEKDGVISTLKPWTAENISFVPSGKLGIIHNAIPIESISPVSGTAYATFNNALIKKWKTQDPFAEVTESELNAFPGVEAIDSIMILQTDTV